MPVSIAHNYMFILLFYRTDLFLFAVTSLKFSLGYWLQCRLLVISFYFLCLSPSGRLQGMFSQTSHCLQCQSLLGFTQENKQIEAKCRLWGKFSFFSIFHIWFLSHDMLLWCPSQLPAGYECQKFDYIINVPQFQATYIIENQKQFLKLFHFQSQKKIRLW